jgi:hypothetical protein
MPKMVRVILFMVWLRFCGELVVLCHAAGDGEAGENEGGKAGGKEAEDEENEFHGGK